MDGWPVVLWQGGAVNDSAWVDLVTAAARVWRVCAGGAGERGSCAWVCGGDEISERDKDRGGGGACVGAASEMTYGTDWRENFTKGAV